MRKELPPSRSRNRVGSRRDRRIYPPPYTDQELSWMQAEAQRRRRRLLIRASLIIPPIVVGIVMASFYITAGKGSGDDRGATGATGAGTSPSAPPDAGVKAALYVNEEGGYSFRRPADWNVTKLGTLTEVSDQSGDVRLTMDIAADGESDQVLEALLPSLTANWSLVQPEAPIRRRVGKEPAISVGGIGEDAGRLIRFLAIVVEGSDHNYMIFVLVPQERDPVTVTPQIEGTVSSFEPLAGG